MANQDRNAQNGIQGSSYLYDYGTTANTRTAVSQKVRILTPMYGSNANILLQIGVLSSFSPSESKNVEPVRGIGFGDQIAELVPSVTEPMAADMERAFLYLSNLWQATGYAGGIDGPVRSLRHHRWPFDIEMQLVFSTLSDADLTGQGGVGYTGPSGTFTGGTKEIVYPEVTNDLSGRPGALRGHSAIITLYEACWFTSYSISNINKDSGMLMETGNVMISDVHDFNSEYGEFLATGNDPLAGQLGSVRFNFGSQKGGTPFINV